MIEMSHLLSFTVGRIKRTIKNYQGLPNGCQLAFPVLNQGSNAFIVEVVK